MSKQGQAADDPNQPSTDAGFGEKSSVSPDPSSPTSDSGVADPAAWYSFGCRLLESGEAAEAARRLSLAAESSPDNPAILEKLAAAYHRSAQYLPALNIYDRLIELDVATAEIWCATGNALADLGEYAQAIGAYENSLKRDGANAEAHHNLAQVLYRLGDVECAAYHLEYAGDRCDAIAPWVNLATLIPGSPRASLQRILEVRTQLASKLGALVGLTQTKSTLHGRRKSHALPRVGYLSAFFHTANYMKPVWGLINNHDRGAFQIHLFSDSPREQEWLGYQRHPEDRPHETATLDNDQLADLIRSSDIDILVDLNAYSYPERLALFLDHPAPVTVAWFNMYATSGLPGFDYIIGDDDVVRPGEESFFTEKVFRLPVSYLTFQVDHPVPPVVPPPCLENPYLTFGSLVSQYKITPPVLDAWANILKRAEGTRLWLANSALRSIHNRRYVADQFTHRGVESDRITLCGPADHVTFLKYYNRIDVALDAFPYNGGTTTMEAIWQGVPVLTCHGDRWASRTSQSLLRRTHLKEFVADDVQGMVDLAIRLARSPDTPQRLADLRRHMRPCLQASSACDTPALARALEQFYSAVLITRPNGQCPVTG
jgi:predicted O-linked N-acetylglucosamine transferase (SPINDLY family)